MQHIDSKVADLEYYQRLVGALYRSNRKVVRHVLAAYRRILKEDTSDRRIKLIAWELEQALVDLDRADLVSTAWGQPIEGDKLCSVCSLFTVVPETDFCEAHLDDSLECPYPQHCPDGGCAGECSNNPRIENTDKALFDEFNRLTDLHWSLRDANAPDEECTNILNQYNDVHAELTRRDFFTSENHNQDGEA